MANLLYAIIDGNLNISGGDFTSSSIAIGIDDELRSIAKSLGVEIEDVGEDEEV